MPKKITEKRLENIALYYLEKYESSSFKLKSVLERRVLKARLAGDEIDKNAESWITNVVQKMNELGYVNDKRYAENQLRILLNNNKSIRYITQKLKQDGIDDDILEDLLNKQENSQKDLDLASAKRLIIKKKIGKCRPQEMQKEMYQKDLAILGRAGFSYEVARQALEDD